MRIAAILTAFSTRGFGCTNNCSRSGRRVAFALRHYLFALTPLRPSSAVPQITLDEQIPERLAEKCSPRTRTRWLSVSKMRSGIREALYPFQWQSGFRERLQALK